MIYADARQAIIYVLVYAQSGNFASQDFDMFPRNSCGSFAEICGD